MTQIDSVRNELAYSPARLKGVRLEASRLRREEINSVLQVFLDHGAGEKASDFRSRLASLLANTSEIETILVSQHGEIGGFAFCVLG